MQRRWWLIGGAALLGLLVLAGAARGRDAGDANPPPASALSGTADGPTPLLRPGNHDYRLLVDGRDRHYVLHVPPSYDGGSMALVVVFHGGGGNWEHAVRISHFDDAADTHGFIVAFPDGAGRLRDRLLTFNAGSCCGYALDQQIDDVAFFRRMVEDIEGRVAVDPGRVFATGMSNGAMMSYRLGCQAADVVVAIAPVAGSLQQPDCSPARPVALLAIHGTDDAHVLFEGGAPRVRSDPHERVDLSVADSAGAFARINGCDPERTTAIDGNVEHWTWTGCAAAVEVLAVRGGAHAWPGGDRGSIFGDPPTDDLDATGAIWAFFEAHPRVDPAEP